MSESAFRYTRKVDLVKDIIGADTVRDAIKVILKYQDVSPIDVDVGNIADTIDVSDEAGRKLGIIYGDQTQALPQEATSPYEPQLSINKDNVGLLKTSDQPFTNNILDKSGSQINPARKTYDAEFTVNQDVNASAFSSSETEVTRCDTISYGLSGAGAFTLTIKFTDGSGTTLYSESYSSSDGSAISGEVVVPTKNVIVEVTDDSGAANTVTGGVYAK